MKPQVNALLGVRTGRSVVIMGSKTWALPADLTKRLNEVAVELEQFSTERRELFDERSERWRDSDRGTVVDTWIENLAELSDTLDALVTVAEGPEE